ncbi:Multiple coagulation factor deficiency protein 2 like protein [Habropoda laboriosa]|uniref:Multiple coagulation factor deficiency protein 2 like protein n=1 Tax=Habropoda laboriosa TaxID=597456 RepID=A0A0L7QMZ0_9HYME|nr:PREDICTED: multiple coagulation factor deficiency protein 2 homolog [Habropoda laboriosa]KOC59919.1 Multiple coagulation factor deficiency protein 2 like protein [Habropoda laboriosa]
MNWTLWLFIIGSFCCKYIHAQQQRVPPGVSPQHYQQPVQPIHQVPQQIPQQQYQQVPGQVPMQQVPNQQVPVQQVPVQQQHMSTHQVPVQQGHAHDHSQPLLNAANIVNEKVHIAEHMEVPIDTSKMTDQELQFHYFKMHDADNNDKLDGCELIKSLIHWHEQRNNEVTGPNPTEKLFKDQELVTLIDPILSMDDINNDGYIDYPEFIQAQQNAAATGRQ